MQTSAACLPVRCPTSGSGTACRSALLWRTGTHRDARYFTCRTQWISLLIMWRATEQKIHRFLINGPCNHAEKLVKDSSPLCITWFLLLFTNDVPGTFIWMFIHLCRHNVWRQYSIIIRTIAMHVFVNFQKYLANDTHVGYLSIHRNIYVKSANWGLLSTYWNVDVVLGGVVVSGSTFLRHRGGSLEGYSVCYMLYNIVRFTCSQQQFKIIDDLLESGYYRHGWIASSVFRE